MKLFVLALVRPHLCRGDFMAEQRKLYASGVRLFGSPGNSDLVSEGPESGSLVPLRKLRSFDCSEANAKRSSPPGQTLPGRSFPQVRSRWRIRQCLQRGACCLQGARGSIWPGLSYPLEIVPGPAKAWPFIGLPYVAALGCPGPLINTSSRLSRPATTGQ